MLKKLFIIIAGSVCVQAVFAEAIINSFRADSRAKVVAYSPNQVYHLKTHYLVSTDIIFGKDEVVGSGDYHLGDASSWDIQASRNHLFVKAKKLDAGGNLNVTTNKYSYHFMLSVSEAPSGSGQQTLFLTFTYPNHGENERRLALQIINVPSDICEDKRKYNLQYSYTGDREQAPVQACDDGLFTYLKFRKQIDLPAVFMVLPDRREEVVNYRMENGYLVIERIAKAFTLRSGATVTSVYNDKYICDWDKVK